MSRRGRVIRLAILGATTAATIAALAMGCSSSEPEGGGSASALRDATGVDWIVSTNAETGAVTFATPKNGPYAIPGAAASLEQTTLAFLDRHKAIFKMADPKTELVHERTDRASDGTSHVRFVQKASGVDVYGGTWIAHFDVAGRLTSMSGAYVIAAGATSTTPTITAEAAAEAAKAEAARRNPTVATSAFQAGTPVLVVVPVREGAPALTWKLTVSARTPAKRVALTEYVDATTGVVRLVSNGILHGTASGRAPQSYPPFSVETPDLTFPVSDDAPPKLQATGASGVESLVISLANPDGPVTATSVSPWTDAVTPPGIAISAMANAETVLAFYADHERNGQPYRSFDGSGATLVSIVNDNSEDAVNAFWDGDANTMHYGDGDPGQLIYPFSASLDMVAHELSHGVTNATSRLEAVDGAESYSLNESLSDVFAALVTHRVRNDDGRDFTFGEDCTKPGTPFRSMIQPTSSALLESGGISTYQAFTGSDRESHRGSNVPSHAFYLLTHGGTHETTRYKVPCGIGWGAADRLYWRVQSTRAQPTETFKDFALHSLTVARELAINERPVACAWVAVGVLTEAEAKNDWNVTCEKDEEAGAPDASDNVLVTQPAQLIECSQPLAGPGVSLTP